MTNTLDNGFTSKEGMHARKSVADCMATMAHTSMVDLAEHSEDQLQMQAVGCIYIYIYDMNQDIWSGEQRIMVDGPRTRND